MAGSRGTGFDELQHKLNVSGLWPRRGLKHGWTGWFWRWQFAFHAVVVHQVVQRNFKSFHSVSQIVAVVAISRRPVLDVILDMVKQLVHVVQIFGNVILVVGSAMSIVVSQIVDVDRVLKERVHLAISLAKLAFMLIVVVHLPADRICFPSKSIGQRIHMTPRTKRVMSPAMSMIGLSDSNTTLLKSKDGDNGD